MPNNSFEHKPAVREVLTACGFDSLRNEKEAMAELIIKVSCAYKVWDFDLSSAANTILKYNGLIVDAAQAIRKSMKEYDFHGGFHFSLEHMLNEQDNLHDEFVLMRRYSEKNLFPVGNAFSEIMSLDEQGKVYAGEKCLADSFEIFLDKLIGDAYKDI